MLTVFLAGLLLGFLIAVTNEGDFPSWEVIVICLASAIFPCAVLNFTLPASLFFVGPIVGAICCAVAIKLTLGMSLVKAAFSAFMFFAAEIGLSFLL